MGRLTGNSGSVAPPEAPRRFPGSILTRHVCITVLKRHGFYCNIYILISSTQAFYLASDAKHPFERERVADQRNIYLAIRTCNNSGYSRSPRRQMDREFSPFMQSIPCLISTRIFYANDQPSSSPLYQFFR